MNIPITKPCFDHTERELLLKPLETGWVVQGPFVREFEEQFAAFVGSPHAVATSNCTTALHLSLIALGIGPGDQVVVPAFTYVASANAVEYVGAEPLFCDIDLATYNLCPNALSELLAADKKSRIKAVMAVSLFGLCADFEKIGTFADKHGATLLEDAACGFGARFDGRHSGTFGKIGCFSFHPRKAITTGEGGMLVTADAEIASLARSLRDHGASVSDLQRHHSAAGLLPEFKLRGYNYRMTDLQGALGVAQMGKAKMILSKRQTHARYYDAAFAHSPLLKTPTVPAGYEHGYQAYVCLVTDKSQGSQSLADANLSQLHERRNELLTRLNSSGIGARPGTHAVPALEYYREKYRLIPESYPSAWAADRLTLALPLFPDMTTAELESVVAAL